VFVVRYPHYVQKPNKGVMATLKRPSATSFQFSPVRSGPCFYFIPDGLVTLQGPPPLTCHTHTHAHHARYTPSEPHPSASAPQLA
jgi:hypothetical protein